GTALDITWTARRAAGVFSSGRLLQEDQEDMVTNYPQAITTNRHITNETHEDGISARVFDRLRQVVCGLHGHDTLMQFAQDRIFLRCVSCGHETHGWELNDLRPAVKIREAPRAPLTRPQLVGERKIA